jgi:hypothetical protein
MRAAPIAARKCRSGTCLYSGKHENRARLYQNRRFFSSLLVGHKLGGKAAIDSGTLAEAGAPIKDIEWS